MDPIGENENPVDTNLKEDEKVDQITPNEKPQEEEPQNEGKEEQQHTPPSTEKDTHVGSSVQEHRDEEKPQPDQEPLANSAPDDKENQKETGEKEKEAQPQTKHWKNNRKKRNKDEQIGDVAQWPTPDEARHSKGQPQKKAQGDSGRNSSRSERDGDRQSGRGRRGINWKPLSELSKTQGTGDQSSSGGSTSSAVEGERANQGSATSSGPGRSYQAGYNRGQPKRRGGGRSQTNPWPRSNVGGSQQFSQDGTTASSESGVSVANDSEGKDDTQPLNDSISATQGGANQTSNPPTESRRYRGSVRGSSRPSNRWRGGGNFTRATYYNRYNPNTRGGPPIAPVRAPQDPEQLREVIKKQIEYYFGVDNLCKDVFLRKNMNNEGWISIHLIMNFNRIRDLNIDLQRFIDSLKDSKVVETKDEFIRPNDWALWTFPPKVDPASQTQPTKSEVGSVATEPKEQS